MKVKSLSRVRFFVTPWTAAYQAPPSMGFSRQEYFGNIKYLLKEIRCYHHKVIQIEKDLNHIEFSDHSGIKHKLVIKRFRKIFKYLETKHLTYKKPMGKRINYSINKLIFFNLMQTKMQQIKICEMK